MRLTHERVDDFRTTMHEIVDISNGKREARDKKDLDPMNYGHRGQKTPPKSENKKTVDIHFKAATPKRPQLLPLTPFSLGAKAEMSME